MLTFYLLETNIRQRGDVGGSAKKVGLRIKELERIYGIEHGGARGNQYVEAKPNNSVLATQEDLAAKLGISVDTLQNCKLLTEMIPELEELIDTGVATPTTALAVVNELTPEEQRELVEMIGLGGRVSKTVAENMIEEIKDRKKGEGSKKEQGNVVAFPEPFDQEMEQYFKEFTESVLELLGRQMTQTMRQRCIDVANKQIEELIDVVHNAKIALSRKIMKG